MDVQDYCKGLEMEMTAWKAKLYDVIRKVDKLGSAEKEKVLPNIISLLKMWPMGSVSFIW